MPSFNEYAPSDYGYGFGPQSSGTDVDVDVASFGVEGEVQGPVDKAILSFLFAARDL